MFPRSQGEPLAADDWPQQTEVELRRLWSPTLLGLNVETCQCVDYCCGSRSDGSELASSVGTISLYIFDF